MAKIYEDLTKYLSELGDEFGKWNLMKESGGGTAENPSRAPYIVYDEVVHKLIKAIYTFDENHPEYGLHNYGDILNEQGIKWEMRSMEMADVSKLDGKTVMALLMGAVRAERFCDGALLSMFKRETIQKWLKRLEELDGTDERKK